MIRRLCKLLTLSIKKKYSIQIGIVHLKLLVPCYLSYTMHHIPNISWPLAFQLVKLCISIISLLRSNKHRLTNLIRRQSRKKSQILHGGWLIALNFLARLLRRSPWRHLNKKQSINWILQKGEKITNH
jgi:hypothetical protein